MQDEFLRFKNQKGESIDEFKSFTFVKDKLPEIAQRFMGKDVDQKVWSRFNEDDFLQKGRGAFKDLTLGHWLPSIAENLNKTNRKRL